MLASHSSFTGVGWTPAQKAVQFSSPKSRVGIRDQNRLKSLGEVRDWARHLKRPSQASSKQMTTQEDNCQGQENTAHEQREETSNYGVREGNGCRVHLNTPPHPHEVQLLSCNWILYNSFLLFVLFIVKYITRMEHCMRSRHRAKNGNNTKLHTHQLS